MIIGTITNWGEVQGQINDAPNVLAGTISSAELMGGQIVGMRGLKGDKGDTGDTGADGQDGADGFSPIANVSKVGDTATITITDENGTTTASVSDGADGNDGHDGADGHSPTITANKVGKVTTVYVDGVAIATINDGQDGGGSSAFIAEYGVTTYADVKDAYDEDAIILCTVDDSGNTVICQLAYYDDANGIFYFAQPQSDGFYLAFIGSDDTWDDSYFQFASTDTATELRNGLMDALDKQKLDNIESGAEVNVQSDWDQSVNTADDYIKNKPTITSTPTANEVAEFDSNARMNSEDMSSQDVDDFVASLNATAINIVDYVVEQSTSGDWSYTKWNSGKCEAWYRGTASLTIDTAVGQMYRTGSTTALTLPASLFTSVSASFVSLNYSSWGAWTYVVTSNTTTLSFVAMSANSRANATYGVSAHVIGTWKQEVKYEQRNNNKK